MKFQPASLQQRTFLFILLPTFALLLLLSIGGFVLLRDILIEQWGEIAVTRLQRTAQAIDVELRRPKELLLTLKQEGGTEILSQEVFDHIFTRLETLDLVVEVNVDWPEKEAFTSVVPGWGMSEMMGRVERYQMDAYDFSSPQYNSRLDNRTVSLISEFRNDEDLILGSVEVIIAFDALIDEVIGTEWWQKYKVYLLDNDGNVLVSRGNETALESGFPMRAFGSISQLEQDTLQAIEKKEYGTVFGQGNPPAEISGFYHLSQAPWTMVVVAPGDEVLRPILTFRTYYIFTLGLCIVLILFVINRVIAPVTERIKGVSRAAANLAGGKFGHPLQIRGRDEVEELRRNFNTMTRQLRHGLVMKEAIGIAREVQQNLLPQEIFEGEGITVSGASLYCDETGGDYLDILPSPESRDKITVVVGDVSGHGVGAALLMASVRALLRCRISQPGNPAEMMDDVNTLLHQDTTRSGNFVTLFYADIDRGKSLLRWIRAGHDPAIVYTPSTQLFEELKGRGIALGVDPSWKYEYNEHSLPNVEQLILLASDGCWEVENSRGEPFGKKRLKGLLAACSLRSPKEIVDLLVDEIALFRGNSPQTDDITLAVIKTQ